MTPENLSRAFATLTGYGVVVNGPEVTIARPVVLEAPGQARSADRQPPAPSATPIGKAERELWPASRAG